jgi:fumarate reductase (CoM/CoB) subunit A
MTKGDTTKHISADVLVIGSGGAGLRAAIEAKGQGQNVLVVTKGRAGRSNCTAVAMGAFRVSQREEDTKNHFQETVAAGRFLNNPKLVRILVSKAWPAVKELETYGLNLSIEEGKASISGDRRPGGIQLSSALVDYAVNSGVAILEKTMTVHLLCEGRTCSGAVALRNGKLVHISAKATILATGGYSQLYKRTDNPPTPTGDGIILAFKAGAQLQDLEFVQFEPMFADSGISRMPILDWLIEATKNLVPGGPLINNKGEKFLSKYNLLQHKILRDNLIVAMERELFKEKEDSLILDLTSLSPEEIEEAFNLEFQKRAAHPFLHLLSEKKLHIASSAHYTMGGIRIDEECKTTVDGLYAAGEVAGGIHGANRLGGNALTEILVFGTIAGHNAADYAEKKNLEPIRDIKEPKNLLGRLKQDRGKPVDLSLMRKEIKSVMSQFCQPVRSKGGLNHAFEILQEIEGNVTAASEDRREFEVQFMLELANLVIRAALERRESRGSHFRIDYPESRKYWQKNIILVQKNGKTHLQYEPVLQHTFTE